jgi:hypothetical protein
MREDAWPAARVDRVDASLRELEAIEAFRREAEALRWELSALRYEVPRRGVPGVVIRLAAEAALIVTVAVIAGVSQLRPLVIVALMAGAFALTALSEWLASRSTFVPPSFAFLPAPEQREEPEAVEALTLVAPPQPDPWEHGFEVA